jgi:nucleoside-diphosphate-sugar epimerase
MNVFVTGANGFIGRNLCAQLEVRGHSVIRYRRGEDLRFLKTLKPNLIFHLAAEIYKPELMFSTNVQLTYELLEATKDVDYETFVYCGSSSEYGRRTRPISERDSLQPTTMYEATKAAASVLCQGYAKPIMIVRPFSVYGPLEPEHRLIPTIYRCWDTHATLSLCEAAHDWIYVEDVIDGLSIAASSHHKGVLNLGTGVQTRNSEVVKIFEELVGEHLAVCPADKMREFDSNCWVCDIRHSSQRYGFRSKHSLRDGLKKYIRFKKTCPSA